MDATIVRISELTLDAFGRQVLEKLGVPPDTARLAMRSMLDASLMGVDTHGVEALDMYVDHLRAGGLDPKPEPILLREQGGLGLWDMQNGFGLASGRKIMAHAIKRAGEQGIYLATCRRTNHIGACGVYGKMAADEGIIGMTGQQTGASLAPWGGKKGRVGASPTAFVAPIADSFPFYYDASFAMMTGAQVKAHIRSGTPLPEGVAMDKEGNPTTDPKKAWGGQILPIGRHKGVGLAMVFEILHCVLSGNNLSSEIPSIVSHPEKSASSSIFMLVIDPNFIMPRGEFARSMKQYVEYVESSPARDPCESASVSGKTRGGELARSARAWHPGAPRCPRTVRRNCRIILDGPCSKIDFAHVRTQQQKRAGHMRSNILAFLLMGQSNMAGRGDPAEVEVLADRDILTFRDGQWVQATEPLHSSMPGRDAIGLGMSFAAEWLRRHPGGRVGLIPCAVGGSPLKQWEPDRDLYIAAVATAKAAQRTADLTGVLWHQGETDAMNRGDATSYLDRLARTIRALRTDCARPNLPFIAGELGRFLGETKSYPYWETINGALNSLGKIVPPAACVSSEGLSDRGDSLHFDAKSLREFGRRYARTGEVLAQSGTYNNS